MTRKKSASIIPSPPPIPIGNCEVRVEAKNFASELTENSLQITFSKDANLKISVMENWNCEKVHCGLQGHEDDEKGNYCFELINPNDTDVKTKSLVQEVLNIYAKELPAMKYAANTGKQSSFLDKCVSSGKYYTLILRFKNGLHRGEAVAATTYQIISADTLYTEIPLAAVRSQYQHKGIGHLLYMELKRRLQNVGIRTVLCWGDKESEGFWLKQGFIVIGHVDARGKARRLPINPNVRRVLCFPGGSSLMVSYLNKESPTHSPKHLALDLPEKNCLSLISQKQDKHVDTYCSSKEVINQNIKTDISHHYDADMMETVNDSYDEGANESEHENTLKQWSCSPPRTNKRTWEASFTSLNSKKVKGSYQTDCHLHSNSFLLESNVNATRHKNTDSLAVSQNAFKVKDCPKDPLKSSSKHYFEVTSKSYSSQGILPLEKKYQVILMNIADDNKKAYLTQIIENLGGDVTSDGSRCTHVVTGKVRKTLNFCKALCSGIAFVTVIGFFYLFGLSAE
ncbi:hypothetical protein DM860_005921 [Cuscuta australis]|uniref:BRCT domain-containing protein n=1 Tax=Cuscuta australis TaxID=267555 RepID=A0A328DS26_9ASTE|nr:hypothetical protein DM860_005921 [Cuscuta australis]